MNVSGSTVNLVYYLATLDEIKWRKDISESWDLQQSIIYIALASLATVLGKAFEIIIVKELLVFLTAANVSLLLEVKYF